MTPPMVSGRWPVLGHLVPFLRNRDALMRRGAVEHGKVFAIDLAGQKVAVVGGAEYNRRFYTATDKELNIEKMYTAIAAAIGEVLFLASHETYINQRPLLTAYFSRERMPAYIEAMDLETRRWVTGLPTAGTLEVSDAMLALAQQVAAHAFVGPRFREELDDAFWKDYEHIARSIDLVLPPSWPLPKFIRRDQARKRIRAVISRVIQRRRSNPGGYNDLIAHTLQLKQKDGTAMGDDVIVSVLMGLLFAGHETTAGQAAWLLITLAREPSLQHQVRREINEHVGAGPLTADTLRKLKYLYMAIDEVTRLYPSADMQARYVERAIEFGPYIVPAGWQVFVNASVSHHLPGEFTDSLRFDPTRIERGEGKSPWSNIGFGGGVHKCTGMNFARHEMAVIVARVVQGFDLASATPDTRVITGLGANRPSATHLHLRRRG